MGERGGGHGPGVPRVTVFRAYLRDRQAGFLALVIVAMGVMVYLGGDFNLPVPGAPVPITLGTLAPLVSACVWITALDARHQHWVEAVTPRRIGVARCGYVMIVAMACAVVVLIAGQHSVGLAVAISLVRGAGILIGLAAVAWLVGGSAIAFGVVSATVMVLAVGGGWGAAEGEIWARWALLFAEPHDVVAGVFSVVGTVVGALAAWSKPA